MKHLILVCLLVSPSLAYSQKSIPSHFGQAGKDAFDKPGLIILGIGSVATLLATTQDQAMHDTWVNNQRMNKQTADFGNFWGSGIPAAGILLGQMVLDSENGIPSLEGVAWSTATTFALKYTVRRNRPDSDTKTAFPSGHTQIAFASATTLLYSYGWKVASPVYGIAVLTGLSRMADNAHWFSDVIAGATIGILFGRSGFDHHGVSLTTMDLDSKDGGFGLVATWHY